MARYIKRQPFPQFNHIPHVLIRCEECGINGANGYAARSYGTNYEVFGDCSHVYEMSDFKLDYFMGLISEKEYKFKTDLVAKLQKKIKNNILTGNPEREKGLEKEFEKSCLGDGTI